jgi:hypothetical protein
MEYENQFTAEDLELEPGKWYVLMLHIGSEEPFEVQIWEYDNPGNILSFQAKMNNTWMSKKWLPLFLVGPVGKLEIERYEELKGHIP